MLVALALVNADLRRRQRISETLALAKFQAESALARLNAFLQHAPYGIAYLDGKIYIASLGRGRPRASCRRAPASWARSISPRARMPAYPWLPGTPD